MIAGKLVHDYQGPQNYGGSPDVLFRNNGDGSFTDVTKDVGLYQPGGKGMGLACSDFDNDGDPDIFVSNDFMINYLFINEGGKFRETGLLQGVALDGNGQTESFMGVDVADVDRDGLFDILIPCLGRESFNLFHNEGSVFSDISVTSGLYDATRGHTGFSPSFLDFDNDGDMDVFVSCGRVLSSEEAVMAERTGFEERYAQTDLLLENDGRGHFRRVADRAGPHFRKAYVARGSAVGDLDNDGDMDVVINNSDAPPVLLRNDTKGGHWLTLRLVGTRSNRDAIGARVVAHVGAETQHHYVRGGGSYLSVSDRRVHIGLGEAVVVDSIEITWPSGVRQVLQKVPAGQFLTVVEPAA
ncbi:CRTAC1 family protein [bacterium]|nr:CRTAC1 family protein [bacterium]